MLTFLRRLRQRPAVGRHAVHDPNVSRAGMATRGMRPGSQRHLPTQAEHDLAEKLGTTAYDSERGRL